MISRWLIMSEHFVKSDCLRLEKIEASYCNLNVKSFALFRSFCIRESSLWDLWLVKTQNHCSKHLEQDACTGVHSACRREENEHNLDISVLRRLRLTQREMQEFLGLKVGGGGVLICKYGIPDLNRAHETERTVFPIPQVFSMCRRRLWHKRKHKGYSTNSAMNTLWTLLI